jgi:hypothetical protein
MYYKQRDVIILIYIVVLINKNYNDNVIRHAMDPLGQIQTINTHDATTPQIFVV